MFRRDIPTLAIDALAVYRLTRLVVKDVILEDVRDAAVRAAYAHASPDVPEQTVFAARHGFRDAPNGLPWAQHAEHDGDAPKLATLVTCYWCAGFYVSVGVIAARRWAPGLWDPLARILATSAVAALTARLEAD